MMIFPCFDAHAWGASNTQKIKCHKPTMKHIITSGTKCV